MNFYTLDFVDIINGRFSEQTNVKNLFEWCFKEEEHGYFDYFDDKNSIEFKKYCFKMIDYILFIKNGYATEKIRNKFYENLLGDECWRINTYILKLGKYLSEETWNKKLAQEFADEFNIDREIPEIYDDDFINDFITEFTEKRLEMALNSPKLLDMDIEDILNLYNNYSDNNDIDNNDDKNSLVIVCNKIDLKRSLNYTKNNTQVI